MTALCAKIKTESEIWTGWTVKNHEFLVIIITTYFEKHLVQEKLQVQIHKIGKNIVVNIQLFSNKMSQILKGGWIVLLILQEVVEI